MRGKDAEGGKDVERGKDAGRGKEEVDTEGRDGVERMHRGGKIREGRLTLSLSFLFFGNPDRDMESSLTSNGVGSISQ